MHIRPQLSDRFLRIVQDCEEAGLGDVSELDRDEFERAKEVAFHHITRIRAQVQRETRSLNNAMIDSRLASIERTFEAKSARVGRYLADAYEPRITRMRQAQLRNLQTRFKDDKAHLEARRSVTTTFSLRLAGLLRLSPPAATARSP
ncbi:hypothetical protein ACFLT5_01715 [Chloroflexota bacterium]